MLPDDDCRPGHEILPDLSAAQLHRWVSGQAILYNTGTLLHHLGYFQHRMGISSWANFPHKHKTPHSFETRGWDHPTVAPLWGVGLSISQYYSAYVDATLNLIKYQGSFAETAGRADHQEWIVPRSIARCGLDTMSSSHQDPICKPCARSPLHRPHRRYTAHCGRLRYPTRYRSLVARCPLRSSAPLA
jgi:hypothetical protein